ncbi:MAG: FxsA family protein [Bacteroidota bacterium]
MFGRLFALFVIVPVLDLVVLVWAGERIGFWPTVGLILLTALVGSWLSKREGLAAWQAVQRKLATGGLPGPELIDGLLILVSGALLLTPGFLTDIAGLMGLIPVTRALARRVLSTRFKRAVESGQVRVVGGAPFGQAPFGTSPFAGAAFDGRPPIEDAEIVDDGRQPV